MKSTKVIVLFMLLLMPLFASSDINSDQAVVVETEETDVYIKTDDLVFRVPTSEIPQYFFWLNEPLATTYKVSFDLMFEVYDVNNDSVFTEGIDIIIPGSFQSLPQMGWVMSEITEEQTPTHSITSFNLTGSEDGASNPNINDLEVQFRNHVMTDGETTELKFDVIVNNYVWKNDSDSTMMVLAFKMDSTDGIKDGTIGNCTFTEFGDAYVYSETEATDKLGLHESAEVRASMSVGSGANVTEIESDTRFYISYTHFDGDLIHDPTIGINENLDNEKLFVADELSIRTPTDNVPFFFFWKTGNDSITYKLQFDAMFEVFDENQDGVFNTDTETMIPSTNVPLALYSWNVSEVLNETIDGEIVGYHFNLTGSPENNPNIGSAIIQFRNHISVEGDDSVLKFDVLINGYEWTNTSDDSMLVLSYKLLSNDPTYEGIPKLVGNETTFGNAFFNSTELAYNNSGSLTDQVSAKLSVGVGDPEDPASTNADARIYIAYSHFEGDLRHDIDDPKINESVYFFVTLEDVETSQITNVTIEFTQRDILTRVNMNRIDNTTYDLSYSFNLAGSIRYQAFLYIDNILTDSSSMKMLQVTSVPNGHTVLVEYNRNMELSKGNFSLVTENNELNLTMEVEDPIALSITNLSEEDINLPGSIIQVSNAFGIHVNDSDGISNALIQMRYQVEMIESLGINPQYLELYTRTDISWKAVNSTINEETEHLSFQTSHFSDWVVAASLPTLKFVETQIDYTSILGEYLDVPVVLKNFGSFAAENVSVRIIQPPGIFLNNISSTFSIDQIDPLDQLSFSWQFFIDSYGEFNLVILCGSDNADGDILNIRIIVNEVTDIITSTTNSQTPLFRTFEVTIVMFAVLGYYKRQKHEDLK